LTRDQILSELTGILRTVLRIPELEVSETLCAKDVKQWDSIAHLDLLAMIEKRFEVRIPTWKIAGIQNVGDLTSLVLALLEKKLERQAKS